LIVTTERIGHLPRYKYQGFRLKKKPSQSFIHQAIRPIPTDYYGDKKN